MASPVCSFADTASTSVSEQVNSLLNQIKALQAQIQTLQSLRDQVVQTQGNMSQTLQIIRNLSEGMSGDDVKALQVALAADPGIYPEGLVTGYYGRMTSEAVKKFQKKYGIEMLGMVGPKTLKKMNEFIKETGLSEEDDNGNDNAGTTVQTGKYKNGKRLCIPPGHLIAQGWLKKNDKPTPTSLVPLCSNKQTHDQNIREDDRHATTTPDVIAPVISGVSTSNLRATSTNIAWSTNESSNGKVWFGTTTPLDLASSTTVSSNSRVRNHVLSLSDLATSTTYYYVVGSSDAAGNVATSSQNTFVTPSN